MTELDNKTPQTPIENMLGTKGPKVDSHEKLPNGEFGGRKDGLEPTRFGDWELKGKCVDF